MSPSVSRILLTVLSVVVAAQYVLGATVGRTQLWGTHAYTYLPAWVGAGALALFVVATRRFLMGQSLVPGPLARERFAMGRWTLVGVVAAAAAAFWLLRVRHDLLGDALPLTHDLPRGIETHPRQPLTMWMQQKLYQLLGPVFTAPGKDAADVAADTVALGSVVCGLMFIVCARFLAAWLAPSPVEASQRRLFVSMLLLQGFSLLFFGYLENYTIYFVAVAFFLLFAVGFLQQRLPLAAAGILLAVLLGLHLSSVVLWPGFLLLLVLGLRRPERRLSTLRDLGITLVAFVGVWWILGSIDPRFELGGAMSHLFELGRGSRGGSYLFSLPHLRDWFQQQMLAGPLTLLFLVPAVPFWWKGDRRDPVLGFLVLTALTCLAATFAADEPMLGYARDWDLFLPSLLPVALAAIVLGWHELSRRHEAVQSMAYVTTVCFLTFMPWLLLNVSEARSLERTADLPLGRGRAAVVVGNWHLRHGDQAAARAWFDRALQENPANNTALSLMANIHAQRGEIDVAIGLFERAVALRPAKIEYREKITHLLMGQGRFAESLPHFEVLSQRKSHDGRVWLRFGEALRGAGREAQAQQSYRRAATVLSEQLRHRPEDFSLNMDLGTVHASLGEFEAAERYLRSAVAARPAAPVALFQLAGVLASQGRQTEAKPFLERLLQVQPNHPQRQAIEQWLGGAP